jgi:hypothetical protein
MAISAMDAPSGRWAMICASWCPRGVSVGRRRGFRVRCGFAFRALATALAATGSIPMASSPASVAISVVPWPSPVSRQSGSPAAEVGIDLFQPAARDHRGDGLLRGGAMQAFGQRHGQIAGAGRRAAEDDGLGVGEFGHGSSPWIRAAIIAGLLRPQAAQARGRSSGGAGDQRACSPSPKALSVMRFRRLA